MGSMERHRSLYPPQIGHQPSVLSFQQERQHLPGFAVVEPDGDQISDQPSALSYKQAFPDGVFRHAVIPHGVIRSEAKELASKHFPAMERTELSSPVYHPGSDDLREASGRENSRLGGARTETNPTHLSRFLSIGSSQKRQNKPIANIPLLFNGLGPLLGTISWKNKWIEPTYAQHRFESGRWRGSADDWKVTLMVLMFDGINHSRLTHGI